MKYLLTLLFACCSFLFSFSQPVVVANARNNTLFVGVENPLSIAVGNVPGKDLIVTASKGTVERIANGQYIYKGSELGIVDVLVYKKGKGKQVEIGKIPFVVNPLPDPTAFVGVNSTGGKVSVGFTCVYNSRLRDS